MEINQMPSYLILFERARTLFFDTRMETLNGLIYLWGYIEHIFAHTTHMNVNLNNWTAWNGDGGRMCCVYFHLNVFTK